MFETYLKFSNISPTWVKSHRICLNISIIFLNVDEITNKKTIFCNFWQNEPPPPWYLSRRFRILEINKDVSKSFGILHRANEIGWNVVYHSKWHQCAKYPYFHDFLIQIWQKHVTLYHGILPMVCGLEMTYLTSSYHPQALKKNGENYFYRTLYVFLL